MFHFQKSFVKLKEDQAFLVGMEKKDVLADGLPIYKRLAVDDQDSVRLLTVEDLIVIANHLTPEEVNIHLLQQLRQSASDKSWRVRYMIASHFVEVITDSVHLPYIPSKSSISWLKRSVKKLYGMIWLGHTCNYSRIMRPRCAQQVLARYLVRS